MVKAIAQPYKHTMYNIGLQQQPATHAFYHTLLTSHTKLTVWLFFLFLILIDYVLASFFTALHKMPARTSYEKAVCLSICPSVRLSVKRVDCDKTEESSVQIFIPYERSLNLVF